MIKDLLIKSRSYRRFDEKFIVTEKVLKDVIDSTRLAPSAANRQPLKYRIVTADTEKDIIFQNIKWAAYLTDWNGPAAGERPSSYILVLHDKQIELKEEFLCFDTGLAVQSLMLALAEKNLGGCIIGSINKEKIIDDLKLNSRYEIVLIIAAGKPVEKVVIDEIDEGGSIKYYRDEKNIHHVPKRKLKDIMIT